LDKPLNEQPSGVVPAAGLTGQGSSAGKYPYPRLTGLRVSVGINYYNYNLDVVDGNSPLGTDDIYTIVEVDAQLA